MKNMNQDLKDNPKWAALYLQDMMDIIQHWADEDSLRQVVCYAKAYNPGHDGRRRWRQTDGRQEVVSNPEESSHAHLYELCQILLRCRVQLWIV